MEQHGGAQVCWRIIPLETPKVMRRCARCHDIRGFASTDRFRVNANGHRIDVWLVYRCTCCSTSWNRPVICRRRVSDIGQDRYQQFLSNDANTAWTAAFSNMNGELRSPEDVAFTVVGPRPPERPLYIRLTADFQCQVRLGRVLVEMLKESRSCIQRWQSSGRIVIENGRLNRPVRPVTRITLRAEPDSAPPASDERKPLHFKHGATRNYRNSRPTE